MIAYLDNAATTKCNDGAVEIMTKLLREDFGNPSSLHTMGMEAESYVKHSREVIAKTLKVKPKEIIFTSGGTESNNLAIAGVAHAKKRQGNHIITTMIEHPSVGNPFSALGDEGFEVSYLPVDSNGVISLDLLKNSLREDTILVSIMHVNNEIGSIEPIEEAASVIHENSPKAVFHVDAIQSYGKLPIYPSKMGIDLLSVSGHKIHGPKGSGFLYANEKIYLLPLLYGGGQENALRSGTENVPAIAGLGVAVEDYFNHSEEKREHLYALKKHFVEETKKIDGVSLNGRTDESSAPHIVSVTTSGIRAEVMLHALEDKGIYVSSGSACSSNKPQKSKTLMAIGADNDRLESTVRFSFSVNTTIEEVDFAIEALKELVPVLNKFKRR